MANLWNDLRRIPGWWDRLRFLFAAPGWYPESVGGPQDPPAITGTEQKFNPQRTSPVTVLLISRWVILLVAALLVLQQKDALSGVGPGGSADMGLCRARRCGVNSGTADGAGDGWLLRGWWTSPSSPRQR